MRALALFAVLPLLACAPAKAPPAPSLDPPAWTVDREALPGGTLRLLEVATTSAAGNLVVQGASAAKQVLPVYVYVFDHPTAGVVLVDAGFGRRTATDPDDYPGRRAANLLGLSMEEGAAAVDRLPDAGIDPAAVKHIVVTHMHLDHIAGLEDFPGAALHVDAREWDARLESGALGAIDTRPFENHADIRHIEWTSSPVGTFTAHADLLGDGSLLALDAPGHTAGHVAVLVNLRSRSYLMTGDAAWTAPHWEGPSLKSGLVRGQLEHDWKANWDTQWRIHRFAADHPELVVLAGHEAGNRGKLPPWPEPAQ